MLCHVGTRGDRHEPVYVDDEDRWAFLRLLTEVTGLAEWRVLSYCFLGNHYHLMLEVPHGNLAWGMHRLNSIFASRFNSRHGYVGSHLFQKRYFSKLIESHRYLLVAHAYVALNPVEAGLSRHAETWPWASTGALLGHRAAASVLSADRALELIHRDRETARAHLLKAIRFPERKRLLKEPTPQNLRDLRRYHDMTFAQLAEHFGTSEATVRRISARGDGKVPGTFPSPTAPLDNPPPPTT
jgi:REP element-mobilizing transposase RayT